MIQCWVISDMLLVFVRQKQICEYTKPFSLFFGQMGHYTGIPRNYLFIVKLGADICSVYIDEACWAV